MLLTTVQAQHIDYIYLPLEQFVFPKMLYGWMLDWQSVNPKSQPDVFKNRDHILDTLVNTTDDDVELRGDKLPYSDKWKEEVFKMMKTLMENKDREEN